MDGQPSPLLEAGALYWGLLVSISIHSVAGIVMRRRLFAHCGGAVGHTAARRALASGRARARLYMVSEYYRHALCIREGEYLEVCWSRSCCYCCCFTKVDCGGLS